MFRFVNKTKQRPHSRDYLEVFPELCMALIYNNEDEFPSYSVKFENEEQMNKVLNEDMLYSPWSYYVKETSAINELKLHSVKEGFGCVLFRIITRHSHNFKNA